MIPFLLFRLVELLLLWRSGMLRLFRISLAYVISLRSAWADKALQFPQLSLYMYPRSKR
jgi:hypothetical protein